MTPLSTIDHLVRVVVESPLRGAVPRWCPTWLAPLFERIGRARHRKYALRCMLDSLSRGEAPYASHLLFDQSGLLNDARADERSQGLNAGLRWGQVAQIRAVYCDMGISDGMRMGIVASPRHQPIEFRWLYPARDLRTVARIQQIQDQLRFREGVVS